MNIEEQLSDAIQEIDDTLKEVRETGTSDKARVKNARQLLTIIALEAAKEPAKPDEDLVQKVRTLVADLFYEFRDANIDGIEELILPIVQIAQSHYDNKAMEVAIGFAEWMDKKDYKFYDFDKNIRVWSKNNGTDQYTTAELFIIYKEQSNL